MSVNVRNNSPHVRHVVGVMTGTSIDGIDAALVRIHGAGLDMRAELIRHVSQPLGELRARLRNAAEQTAMNAEEFAKLSWDFGLFHAQVIQKLIASTDAIDLICAHGQTIFHQPPISWQLLNPSPIAAAFKCPVAFDLRQADIAAGGQGAPITPIADWILFRDDKKSRAVVNLGGFCNVTILPRNASAHNTAPTSAIKGFDVCPCNNLLDEVARKVIGVPFDESGQHAANGHPNRQATLALTTLLASISSRSRSLGTGDELLHWVEQFGSSVKPCDLAASATFGLGAHIGMTLWNCGVDEAVFAGGGTKNRALMSSLKQTIGAEVPLTTMFGVPVEAREAMCFAILGALCQDRVPITLPQITGCAAPAPISGVWCLP